MPVIQTLKWEEIPIQQHKSCKTNENRHVNLVIAFPLKRWVSSRDFDFWNPTGRCPWTFSANSIMVFPYTVFEQSRHSHSKCPLHFNLGGQDLSCKWSSHTEYTTSQKNHRWPLASLVSAKYKFHFSWQDIFHSHIQIFSISKVGESTASLGNIRMPRSFHTSSVKTQSSFLVIIRAGERGQWTH